jgi:hypothetical protein
VDSTAWINGQTRSVEALAFANNDRVGKRDDTYPFAVEFQRYRRWGASVERRFKFEGSPSDRVVWFRAKAFLVDQYKSANTAGVVTESAQGNVGLRADVEQDELGRRTRYLSPQKTLGVGYGFDIGTSFPITPEGLLRVELMDLGPSVDIKHVLRDTTKYNSNRVSYDQQGNIIYLPAVSGQYADAHARLKIQPTLDASLRWTRNPGFTWLGGFSHRVPYSQAYLGAEWVGHGVSWATTLHAGSADLPLSVGLQARYKGLSIVWRGDSLQPGKARIWSLVAGVAF